MPEFDRPYIRTASGNTFHVETLTEALALLVSDDGYRLTIGQGPSQIVLRRLSDPRLGILPGERVLDLEATVRGSRV